jgi:hypothetical protein
VTRSPSAAPISAAAARRIALAAQGFATPRPAGRVDRRHVRRVFDQVGLIQIDSVNVLVRSEEMPLFARLGPHPRDLLRQMVNGAELFEYWAHEASLLPVAMQPLCRFRMGAGHWVVRWAQRLETEKPGYLDAVLKEVARHGPLVASELSDPGAKQGPWWGWAHGKQALELLFHQGRITARRRPNFEREYDLPERYLPPDVLAAPTPSEHDSRRGLLTAAARSLGIATERDLCDYYRLNIPRAREALRSLVDDGTLEPATVEGWKQPGYLWPAAARPRRIEARALLSPFDSLVWERARVLRLWDFHYRIEIYTPAPKRVYGYYVLPFLLGDALVGRVDLKADRKGGRLVVPGAFTEPSLDVPPAYVADELAGELALMASWLGLGSVEVPGDARGDLARPLRAALRGAR